VIRGNEVSFTGTEPSGENAAFDADIDSFHTIIEDNWSHDNQGGLFSLCNNPSDDSNVTDGTVVRFNVSETMVSEYLGSAAELRTRSSTTTRY
jgi:hypothetical protein